MKTIIIDGIEYNLTPKVLFKKGDFVVIQETTYQITKVENLNVTLSLNGRECIFDMDVLKNAHLWTIQDAKDGDVLNSMRVQATIIFKGFANDGKHILAYCALQKGIFIKQEMLWDRDFEPCPKNWNNKLFQKMKEEGYIWDADKKELRKIVVPIFKIGDTIIKKHNSDILYFGSFTITDITGGKYWYNDRIICDITEQDEWELVELKSADKVDQHSLPVSDNSSLPTFDESIYHPCTEEVYKQKPVWSEEDENRINRLIAYFEDKESFTAEDDIVYANWLKSLRPQTTWKPSEEQMEEFRDLLDDINWEGEILVSLYNDLKKLREE